MTAKTYDLTIIGGGIMGLMTAYYAAQKGLSVLLLEKRTIGNQQAASYSFTRTFRTDYLNTLYASLAYKARGLWLEIQALSSEKFLIEAGCLNVAKNTVTSKINQTYGAKSYQVISKLGYNPTKYSRDQLVKKYPQINADAGWLDKLGGYLDLQKIKTCLINELQKQGVMIVENVNILAVNDTKIFTNKAQYSTKKIVITAGIWTNEILELVQNNKLLLPLSLDRPKECKYYYPANKADYLPDKFPVFAYLDIGIYGHPIFDYDKGAVKISYYNPTDMEVVNNSSVNSISEFVRICLPDLKDAKTEDVSDADKCYYDLVSDDNFIVGALPGFNNIFVGCGWRGTGYKFAPLIGKIMSQLAANNKTEYEITKFDPGRFIK